VVGVGIPVPGLGRRTGPASHSGLTAYFNEPVASGLIAG